MTATEEPHQRTDGPIHGWFGLTYSSYQVLPRVLMQSMPLEWQRRMVACLEELRAEFSHVEQPESYEITPCRWVQPGELTGTQRRLLDIDVAYEDDDEEYGLPTYYDRNGDELDRHQACAPLPVRNPLPAYRHGYVPPASDGTTPVAWAEPRPTPTPGRTP
jgi:hypothetical protein